MKTYKCPRCDGKGGRPEWPGFTCYRCEGSRVVNCAPRKSAPKVVAPRATIKIENIFGGDPAKTLSLPEDTRNNIVAYFGLTIADLEHYAALWISGVREVPNPAQDSQ